MPRSQRLNRLWILLFPIYRTRLTKPCRLTWGRARYDITQLRANEPTTIRAKVVYDGGVMGEGSLFCAAGHENVARARFCVVCGASIAGTEDTHSMEAAPLSDAAQAPTRRTRVLARHVGVVAGAVLIVAGALYFILTAPVPDVVSSNPSMAASTLTAGGFTVGDRTEDFSASVPRGSVVSQSPSAGSRSRKGSPVALVVSRGPAVITPEVSGLMVTAAKANLTNLSLTVDSESVISETVPEGQVMSQEPVAGERVEQGSSVHLVLSAGPPTTTLTVNIGVDSTVTALTFGDCDLAVTIWQGAYDDSVVVNRDGKELSSLSGRWTADPANGIYYPCSIIGLFPETSTTEAEYRVNLDRQDPEGDSTGWYTRAKLEAVDWDIRFN